MIDYHALLRTIIADHCATDTAIRDLCRGIIGDQLTDGDSYGVPPLEDVVAMVIERLRRAE